MRFTLSQRHTAHPIRRPNGAIDSYYTIAIEGDHDDYFTSCDEFGNSSYPGLSPCGKTFAFFNEEASKQWKGPRTIIEGIELALVGVEDIHS